MSDSPQPIAEKYPLHEQMKRRAAERAGVQAAIDWIAEQGYDICEDRSRPSAEHTDYQPIRLRQDKLVAAIMEIDYDAFMAEKDAMLDELRAMAND